MRNTTNTTSNKTKKTVKLLALIIAALFIFAGCSGTQGNESIGSGVIPDPASSAGSNSADDPAGSGTMLDGVSVNPYVESSTRAVVVSSGIDIHSGPDGAVVDTLDSTTSFGTTRVLLVEEQQGDWVKVRLPTRPNHRSGWIPVTDVQLEPVALAVYVDLQARTLAVTDGGDTIVNSPIAIGTAENPTPLGTFYVTDKLETPNPSGSYGPYALGLSGHSETLTEFAGGEGQIGIHGTDDPATIGQAVSHGCVRLPNDVIAELAALLPLGTPVHIV
ncbi:MAG: L,D-transpeptidase family protein [Acidimicrobiales bacterium]